MSEDKARIKKLERALRPFADAVFNDNGDVTYDTSDVKSAHYFAAYVAMKGSTRS